MARLFLLMWTLCLSFCFSLSAKIIETSDLRELAPYIEKLDTQSLFMWDVDNALIVPKDQVLRPRNDAVMDELAQHYIGEKSKQEWRQIVSQILSHLSYDLVDARAPDMIRALQKKGIPTIAFTAMRTGKFGVIPSMENWRIQQLRELGIDFRPFFLSQTDLKWEETISRTRSPVFKEGILCSDSLIKGPVLTSFFEKLAWKPTSVIFIDDTLSQLTSVEEALNRLNIPFIGFYYRATEHLASSLDLEVAHYQYKILAEKGVWLSDQEARVALQQKLLQMECASK